MATANLKSVSVGGLQEECGNGTPDHASALGVRYTDKDTGHYYRNSNGASGWNSITQKVTTVNTATYTVLSSDEILNVTRTATGTCVVTWPTALMDNGRDLLIKDAGFNASSFNITVDTGGAETIDGSANWTINGDGDWIGVYSDGSNLFIKA